MTDELELTVRTPVDDVALSRLHRLAFGTTGTTVTPWAARLQAHSLSWVQAHAGGRLVGFANVAWDGGAHAFLLDVVVDPTSGRHGLGTRLVEQTRVAAAAAGCAWLHVDFEPHLDAFYLRACGFAPSAAGVLRLRPDPD